MQLQSACAVLTEVGREIYMVTWKLLLWSEVTVNDSCVKLLSAEAEGKQLANRARDEGRSDELSKVCHQTERRVLDLAHDRRVQGHLESDTQAAIKRSAACVKLTKE